MNIQCEEIIPVTFHPYTEDDHGMFLDCVNDFYDGGYPYKEYLEKDNLLKQIEENKLILTLAKNKEGLVVGTVGAQMAEGNFDGSVLLLLRSVLTRFRGQKIASRQLKDLLERIDVSFPKAKSFYADVMTHDSISQTSLCHRHYTFCGLRLMAYKNEIIAPKIEFAPNTKMTQAVYSKAIDFSPVSICVPQEHKELIKSIYDDLGVECFVKEESLPTIKNTEFSVHENEVHLSAQIDIMKTGEDICEVISQKTGELLKKGYTLIAYINMCDEASQKAYRLLENQGFYFSGIKPLSIPGEYIIMSQTDNCVENFQDISIANNKQKVIDYILKNRRKHTRKEDL